ncbi:MAG: alpha/beta fold hydrolase [Flavisolibacter sp.]
MEKIKVPLITLCLFRLIFCFGNAHGQQLAKQSFIFLTSDHIKTPVKVSGKGYPCMFVPGGPGGGYISFKKLGGSALEKNLTMIYMDPRGSGSAQNAANYSLDRILQDMDEVRAKLHIQKMYLLSHSFGGIILINYARKYPQHVKGLILVNSTLHIFDEASVEEQIEYGYHLLGKDTIIQPQPQDSLIKSLATLRPKMSKKHLGYKFLTDSISTVIQLDKLDSVYPRTNDFAYAILAHVIDSNKKTLYPEYFKDYRPLSAKITAPTLVITGTHDHAVGINHYKQFKFPHQKTVRIDGGHLLYYERNKEFIRAVNEFTTSVNKN